MKIFFLLVSLLSVSAQAKFERIIVVGGPVAEIIKELGEADKIVALDITSTVVPGLEGKTNLGSAQKINAEAVIALKPDLFIHGANSKNDQLFEHLKSAKINIVTIPEENNLESINAKVEMIAKLLGVEGKPLTDRVNRDLAELAKKKKDLGLKVGFIYARGVAHLFLAGKDTPAHGIFDYIGVKNAFESIDGFKPISSESLITGNPEYLIMLKSGVASLDNNVWAIQGLSHTIAGKNKRLVEVDTLPFLGFIPRTPKHLISLIETLEKSKK